MVDSEAAAKANGLNCIALAHLVLRDRGIALPRELNFYELYLDEAHSSTVSVDAMEPGDLVWFGLANPSIPIEEFIPEYDDNGFLVNWQDRAVKHVAINTGEEQGGVPLLLHATDVEGTNTIWPLDQFREHARYERIYRVSRVAGVPALHGAVDLATGESASAYLPALARV
jgi:hypothetical protein